MALTKAELLVAAECAAKYPPGRGASYFSHRHVPRLGRAVKLLRDRPELVEYG